MIVCADEFRHFGRFLTLCGLAERSVDLTHEAANIQFFTEYGFAESRFPAAVRARFPEFTLGRDTPDVLIYVAGEQSLLLGVEAKMYDVPDRVSLENQLDRQEQLLFYIAQNIGDPEIAQVALLPEKLGTRISPLSAPIVTWEALADEFADVAPQYFVQFLRHALDQYDNLVSRPPDRLLGQEILLRFQRGDREYNCMGRQGGLDGEAVANDLRTGRWRIKAYSCRPDPEPPNQNWFRITDFAKRVEAQPGPQPINP